MEESQTDTARELVAPDGRRVAMMKLNGGYAVRFTRPAEHGEVAEGNKTAVVVVENDTVATHISLSSEALLALIHLGSHFLAQPGELLSDEPPPTN